MRHQPKVVIVTRHPALVTVLAEDHNITGETIAHATPDQVRGNHVVGVLPLHLASLAASVTELTLELPPELRGTELTPDQVRAHAKGLNHYVVQTATVHAAALTEAQDHGLQGGHAGWHASHLCPFIPRGAPRTFWAGSL